MAQTRCRIRGNSSSCLQRSQDMAAMVSMESTDLEMEEVNSALDMLGMLSRPVLARKDEFQLSYVRPQLRDKAAKVQAKEHRKRNKEERLMNVHARQEEALAKSKKNGTLRKRNVYNADGSRRGKHSCSAPRKATEHRGDSAKHYAGYSSDQDVESFWDEVEETEVESMYMWNGGMGGGRNERMAGEQTETVEGSYSAASESSISGRALGHAEDDDDELRLALELSRLEFQREADLEREEIALRQQVAPAQEEADPDLLLAIELSKRDMEAAAAAAHEGMHPSSLYCMDGSMLDSVTIGDQVEIEPDPARKSAVAIRTRGTVQEIIGWDHATGDLRVCLEEGVTGSLRRIISV